MSRVKAVIFMAIIWLGIGAMLLYKGIHFVIDHINSPGPLLRYFNQFDPSIEQASLLVVCLGLLAGFIKGRFVFKRVVERFTNRVSALPEPIRISQVFPKAYLLLIAIMVSFGVLLRFVPIDIRGCIDVAIGSALINGSILYFRALSALSRANQ